VAQEEHTMLEVEDKSVRRVTMAFSMLPRNLELIKDLADAHNTNSSRIIEAMVQQYGPKLLELRLGRRRELENQKPKAPEIEL
jgi:hypothetical protein